MVRLLHKIGSEAKKGNEMSYFDYNEIFATKMKKPVAVIIQLQKNKH